MPDMKETLRSKKLFLLDMDGTLYLDDHVFDHCLDFLEAVKRQGGKYLYITNNSSKSVDKYVEKMNRIHIPAVKDEFFTSTDAACVHLRNNYHGNKIYALGTASFKEQLRGAGFPITDRLEDDIDCLLMGFDTELTFQKLEDACILLGRGVEYLATNPDWVCPTAYGFVPDCGSVSQMLYNATKRMPYFIGKPEPAMALLAIEKAGCRPEDAVLIGDRIYTDIACGVNAGITTVLVFSGETTREDWEKSEIKSTYTCQDIAEIYRMIR
ncbi:MAG: HAD-IIA family hydrolase [Clostridiales bacterium]|nr:HAD-IIA family hydrolase [Clostridiales bacterium]